MFLWAIGFPAVEVLLESWGSLTLVFLRFFITAIILFPFWFIIEGAKAFKNLPLFRALMIGFFGWGFGCREVSHWIHCGLAMQMDGFSAQELQSGPNFDSISC